MMEENQRPANFDAYAPPEIDRRVENIGVVKARMPVVPLLTLSILAGAFIALGAALFRGILCNVLVCLAIWLSYASHRVSGKILAIVFPITAFVALGFEHSVANMYLIPTGFLAGAPLDIAGFALNLVLVTLGNVVGGGVLVASVYWLVYIRPFASSA